ncbi:MAG: Fur family transcriptional regulator [Planctomycetota bacterium]
MPRPSEHFIAVIDLLEQAPGPLSAQEIHEALAHTGIGLATVYRLVKRGVQTGRFTAVEVPDGPTHYEPSDRPHHHHFECTSCHRIFDVEGCPGHFDELTPEGFKLESHEVFLRGRCSTCVEESGA